MTENQKRELVVKPVTLNGRPAVIGGVKCAFAQVATLDGTSKAEWAWGTVARIVAKGGQFKL